MIRIKKTEFEEKDRSLILSFHAFEAMRNVFWVLYRVVESYRFESLSPPFEMEGSKETYAVLIRDKSAGANPAGIRLALHNLEGLVEFSEPQRCHLDSFLSALEAPPTESTPLLASSRRLRS